MKFLYRVTYKRCLNEKTLSIEMKRNNRPYQDYHLLLGFFFIRLGYFPNKHVMMK